ncbi:double-stranded RNA-binding protein 6 [Solanum lycopersicum]
MANNESIRSMTSCYVFKSRLQEYAQKVGLPTPVYETIKEGPSHEPTFTSTVIVDNDRYDSLPGFYNRKAAEQSAAEVALMSLGNSGSVENLSQPVHETGLCKNLLQEYAQKMNFAIPQYECERYDSESKIISFTCTVDVGGMKYIGAAARTKKEAEIKAARTALLAVQSSGFAPNYSSYTVVPMKKVTDLAISNQESAAALKPKKHRFKKKQTRNFSDVSYHVRTKIFGDSEVQMVNQAKPEMHENAAVMTPGTGSGPAPFAGTMGDLVPSNNLSSDYGTSNIGINSQCGGGVTTEGNAVIGVDYGTSKIGINSQCGGGVTTEGNAVIGVEQVTSEVAPVAWNDNLHVQDLHLLHENAAVMTQGTGSGPAPFAGTMGDLVPSNNCGSDYGTSNLGINSQCGEGATTEGNAGIGVEQVTSEVAPVACNDNLHVL